MADIIIEAAPREAGSSNAARRLRRERRLPAVVYGGDKSSRTITLDPAEIVTILKSESGQNTIFKLKVDGGGEEDVMIFDVQIDPLSHSLQHADLMRIAMDVTIEVSVPIHLIGEPAGVVKDGGVLDHSLRELLVSCLPGNIPESIDIDVSHLEINDSIRVGDLEIPADVTLETDPGRSVASVVPPVSEEELEADLGIEVEEPLVEGEEPLAEGEEPEEGEKAAEGEEATEEKAEDSSE